MEEIKVGEYVRLEDGIIGKVIPYDNGIKIKITEIDTWKPTIESIKKHSFNIIDLIEVGDYVNGHKVANEIWGEDDNNLYFEIEGGFNKAQYIGEKNIKSIVTKEQFENAEYKLDN